MKNPLISIITPCYNSSGYINRLINCLKSQTYKNIEWIVVNDGSKDETEIIINTQKSELEKLGIKMTYVYQENKGLGGAINTGLKYITGDLFTWLDSDNFLSDDGLQEMIKPFEDDNVNIVRCDGYVVNDGEIDKPVAKLSDNIKNKFNPKLFYSCLNHDDFFVGFTMLRTSAFDKVNSKREIYESREGQNFQLLMPMFYWYDSTFIDKPLFYFVVRKDSVSNVAVSKNDIEKRREQIDEYQTIADITIKSMNIAEEAECLRQTKGRYAIIRFWMADEVDNLSEIKKQYRIIKESELLTNEIERHYKKRCNPIWRIFHYLKKLKNRK